mmetsp:Transcript_115339/g.182214  ORF Transcript_115339/g.182214 Transcript_115339/m.182214 type:complete len:476 (+) Transcript_115339:59-1486(+)
MSWFSYISESYSVLWKMIIRPPRARYQIEDLGPAVFRIGRDKFEREDLQLKNDRGLCLECSHYRPRGAQSKLPCVIYLHANASCRLEALDVIDVLLPHGFSIFCFDFSGCGKSEGEYISLGFWEEQDLSTVIRYLRSSGRTSSIALWGRSMGGAAAIFRAAQDPLVAACVIDATFSSLYVVVEELVSSGKVPVPSFLLSMAMAVVGQEVESRAEFDFRGLAPVEEAQYAVSPVLFGVPTDDDFVLPHHTYDNCQAWGGSDKSVITYEGGHNGRRPEFWHTAVIEFLKDRMTRAQSERYQLDLSEKAKQLRKVVRAQENASMRDDSGVPSSLRSLPLPRAPSHEAGTENLENSSQIAELVAMGFDQSIAAEAMKRSSSVEGALDFILQQSVRALGNSLEVRAPDRHCWQHTVIADDGRLNPSQAPERISSGGALDANALVEQLGKLGISPSDASEAARRCSSVEAAMEWLVSNNKL